MCMTSKCRHCGAVFRPKQKGRVTFCSRECAFIYKSAAAASRRRTFSIADGMLRWLHSWRKCNLCGRDMLMKSPHSPAKCCRSCKKRKRARSARMKRMIEIGINSGVRACQDCGVDFTPPHLARFRCDKCRAEAAHESKRAAKRRRRMRSASGDSGIRVVRRKVFERDGWVCGICHQPVERGEIVPHPMAPTVDHKIPLSLGGSHTYENTQCAHFICNSRRGNQPLEFANQVELN